MKPGDKLRLKSNAYDCLEKGKVSEVKMHEDGETLYIECDRGRHYLYPGLDDCDFEEIS